MKNSGFIAASIEPFEEKVASYIAVGPAEGREMEYAIMSELHAMRGKLRDIHRDVIDCNVIMARTIGRTITFLNTPSAAGADDAR